MSNILDLDGNDEVVVETIAAGDDEFTDGDGTSTSTYNDSGASSTNNVTFLKTELGRVDNVMAVVQTGDTDAATGAIQARASPATGAAANDLDGLDDAVEPSYVLLELFDTSDGTEVADDTDVSDLEVTLVATRE